LQAGRAGGVVQQLGRTHRRATGAGRKHTLAVIGKEYRVDQFGLAAREFGNESHIQLVFTQPFQQMIDALLGLTVVEFLRIKPVTKIADGIAQRFSPLCIGRELVRKSVIHHNDLLFRFYYSHFSMSYKIVKLISILMRDLDGISMRIPRLCKHGIFEAENHILLSFLI
jgi:hypothetical protein